ncbi:MAG TPA: Smr/MutS family protein [Polyangiaceae bacterium]|nr:Smr/MutS family protein [Polyangiaceae bacterium]
MSKRKKPDEGPFERLRAIRDALKRKERGQAAGGALGPPVEAPPRADPRAAQRAERDQPRSPSKPQDDEDLLLHRLFAGVKPLSAAPGRIPRQRVERSAAAERASKRSHDDAVAEAEAVHEHIRLLVDEHVRFEVVDDGQRVEGRRLDVPVDVVRKLRRGMIPIDAQVDLHGMRLQEARTHLEFFLRTMRARAERCVLVVHGKGQHSPSGLGALRGEISAWLSQGRASEHVAAFATARHDDGGQGAVYVLLRR